MIQFEWKDLAWILGVGGLVSGGLIAFVQWKLGAFFAKASDLVQVAGRVTTIEERMSRMPSHEDLRQVQGRVGDVEKGVAVIDVKVEGLGEIMKRVERQTNLLVDYQLRKEQG